jgi:nucleoside-diphosphate-sugar epimerase
LAERLLTIASKRLDSSFCIVRPTCIYGPGQHLHNAIPVFLRACLDGKAPTVYTLKQTVGAGIGGRS